MQEHYTSDDAMKYFADKRVTVMGLGTHGGALGNIRWLHNQQAKLTVTDLKTKDELSKSLESLKDLTDINWVLGEHREQDFVDTDMVIRNPAVPRSSRFLQLAREAGVPVEMDSSLFFRFSPTKNIFGVTGSKGKTTTAQAIAHLLSLKYGHVTVVGTEGSSPLAALPTLHSDDIAVFELSSWRLEALAEKKISPRLAVVTSLYEDHLNSYDSMEDYIETKKAIIRYQNSDDLVLLNYDDPRVRAWRPEVKGRVTWYTLGNTVPEDGIFVDRGTISIMRGREPIPLFSINEIKLVGEHQRRNILPAIYAAFCAGIRIESIIMQLRSFTGVQHRLEPVRTLRNVNFINDTAATIPDATIAALKALANKPIVLIIGGSDKKLFFEKLAQATTQSNIRAYIFLPGNATPRLRASVMAAHHILPPVFDVESMQEAVTKAYNIAQPGDTVLLSPGAASFGLFKHEFDRGDQFKNAVMQLQ